MQEALRGALIKKGTKLKDVEDLIKLEPNGVEGVIIGKALYDKSFTYPQALKMLDRC